MDIEMQGEDRLVAVASGLVAAFVANNHVQVADLPVLIRSVHDTLVRLAAGGSAASSVEPEKKLSPAEIRRSIRSDALISFEDGKAYKTLRRHLTVRGLTPEAYRTNWGLPTDYPMTASSYSATRSQMARELGLGRLPVRQTDEPDSHSKLHPDQAEDGGLRDRVQVAAEGPSPAPIANDDMIVATQVGDVRDGLDTRWS